VTTRMAEAKHGRVSRKALREPDEFQTLTAQSAAWVRANQVAVSAAVVALLVVAAVIFGVSWYGQRQAREAASRFDAAHALYESKDFTAAAADFGAVAAAYPRTGAGALAALYRAHALARVPDPAAAAAAYEEYLRGSGPAAYLRQEALIGLAQAREAAHDGSGAQDAYRQAAELDGPFRTTARLALARLELEAGNVDKAKGLYAELAKSPDLDPATREEVASHLPRTPVNPGTDETP
jgi:hypothetical protein